jgi:hypothetical protein
MLLPDCHKAAFDIHGLNQYIDRHVICLRYKSLSSRRLMRAYGNLNVIAQTVVCAKIICLRNCSKFCLPARSEAGCLNHIRASTAETRPCSIRNRSISRSLDLVPRLFLPPPPPPPPPPSPLPSIHNSACHGSTFFVKPLERKRRSSSVQIRTHRILV